MYSRSLARTRRQFLWALSLNRAFPASRCKFPFIDLSEQRGSLLCEEANLHADASRPFWTFTWAITASARTRRSGQFCTDELPIDCLVLRISDSGNSGVGDREMRVLPPVA